MGQRTTFHDWVNENEKDKEIEVMLQDASLGDYKMDKWDILDLMKEAWDARYNTLTTHDL